MVIHSINADEFVKLSIEYPVLDVRSPAEYAHAHVPGAWSLPLFTDEERARIGTAYKQVGREEAIKIGLSAFGPRMKEMVESVERIVQEDVNGKKAERVLVHCWRGGMRSAAVAWLLDLYGFTVHLLEGGYKAYRQWVLSSMGRGYPLNVIGGNTGAGKTAVLQSLQRKGYGVLDLEDIAGHKGSAFGGLNGRIQPGQEQFENDLSLRLYHLTTADPQGAIFVEDESQRIGTVNLPGVFFETMRKSRQLFLEIPFEARLNHILDEYGAFPVESLINAIVRIKKRLGPLETKTAVNHLIEGDTRACFGVLLHYYDKQYGKALQARGEGAGPVEWIACPTVDVEANTRFLIKHLTDTHARS